MPRVARWPHTQQFPPGQPMCTITPLTRADPSPHPWGPSDGTHSLFSGLLLLGQNCDASSGFRLSTPYLRFMSATTHGGGGGWGSAGPRTPTTAPPTGLRFMVITICLCHGGICELSICCSWPKAPPANNYLPKVPPSGVHGDPTLNRHQGPPRGIFVHFAPQHYP